MSSGRLPFWKFIEDPDNSLEDKIKLVLNQKNCSCETLSVMLDVPKNRVAMEMQRLLKWKEVRVVSKRTSRLWGPSSTR